MKNIKQIKIALFTLMSIVLLSFTALQITQENELIIGTWVSNDEPDWKWKFKNDGKCYDYYDGVLTNTYTFSITEEKSINGKLTLSYLELVNINNSEEVFEYEINGLGNNKMTLDYLGDLGTKLTYFTKE